MIHKTRPLFLLDSPMCTWFSVFQNLSKQKVSATKWEEGYRRAVEHIKFVFELCDIQVRGARYFLSEHLA